MSSDGDPDDPDEPFIPLGSEHPLDEPETDPATGENDDPDEPNEPDEPDEPDERYASGQNLGAHAAIARSLSPTVPRVLRKEARAFFDGAMYAYSEGDLAGARLSFLAVAAIGDPDTAPAATVFLGVIAFRRRDAAEARMWFTRAASGPDEHWALVAAQELRRVG